MTRMLVAVASAFFGLSAIASASTVTLTFSGIDVTVMGEYVNAVELPTSSWQFAPLFKPSETITATVSYDTNQPNISNDPNTGTYRNGTLSVDIPQIGLSASQSGSMQISVFLNVPELGFSNDQFLVYAPGTATFVNSVGLPDPTSFDIFLFGNTSMLKSTQLPTGPMNWTFGSASFDFLGTDGSTRQVLLEFTPAAVPEPFLLIPLALGAACLVIGGSISRKAC